MLDIFKELKPKDYMPNDKDSREQNRAKIALIEKEMQKNTLFINIIISIIGLVGLSVIALLAFNK